MNYCNIIAIKCSFLEKPAINPFQRREANGGLAGSDVRFICKSNPPRIDDVSGIGSHEVRDLPIVSVGGVV